MRKTLILAAAVSAIALSSAANAAVVINSSDAVGTQYVIDFAGQVNGASMPSLSSLLTLTFNGLSNDGKTYNFSYNLLNDSTVSSNLRSFGFDVAGAPLNGASATGSLQYVGFGNNFPEGIGTLDVCFRSNSNGTCTGGQGGLAMGQSGSGTLALNFSGIPSSITLDRITTRYQSVNGKDSGVGIGTSVTGAVPEPSTWALMILGFGAVGMAMRRRRNVTTKVSYA